MKLTFRYIFYVELYSGVVLFSLIFRVRVRVRIRQGRSSPASLQYAADLGLATDWYSVFLILDPIWRFVVVIVY